MEPRKSLELFMQLLLLEASGYELRQTEILFQFLYQKSDDTSLVTNKDFSLIAQF